MRPPDVAAHQTGGHHAGDREHAEDLARREQERADRAGPDERVGSLVARLLGEVGVTRSRAVGAQRLGARDDLAHVRQHLGVGRPSSIERGHEVALHALQHEPERRGDRERDDREQPVVGEHHARHEDHQRAVEQPREGAPGEELRQRLHVAGDARDERALPLLVVIGDAQPVDVLEQAHPQRVERLLGAVAQPLHRGALADGGDEDHDEADHRDLHDDAGADLVAVEPTIDRLLHEHRHDDAPSGAGESEQERDADPGAQGRRLLDAPTDHPRRAPPADRLAAHRLDRVGSDGVDPAGCVHLVELVHLIDGDELAVALERPHQLAVAVVGGDELLVRAVGDDDTLVEVEDLVRERDGRRP